MTGLFADWILTTMDLKTDISPTKKALQINLDDSLYGTFAEIGAGQEVARHFFQAGRASHTIAKTMSAYDMTISDEIYGKESRYVCESRLLKMLDHEYTLLEKRLESQRGSSTKFFAFADTVATSTQDSGVAGKNHGWMGVRFQTRPHGPTNDIILHVKMWDRFRLQQQDALGILGVNLLHAAFFPAPQPRDLIAALLDNLSPARIEVDFIRLSGPDLKHFDNRLLSLELVQQHLTDAILFSPRGEVLHASDALFKSPVFIQRGTFRPITKMNFEIMEHGLRQFKKHPLCIGEPKVLFEITMSQTNKDSKGPVDFADFLSRVDTLTALGEHVLISRFDLFYQMKSYLRQNTDQLIGVLMGVFYLDKMLDKKFYESLHGGILEGMSRLFDEKTRVFSFPFQSRDRHVTARTYEPPKDLAHLYQHLLSNELITDLEGVETVDTSVLSRDVRVMLETGDPKWKTLVPDVVSKMIEERRLFGLKR